MKVEYSPKFTTAYKKLSEGDKDLVDDTIELFIENPNNPLLKNHYLKNKMHGMRSIYVDDDLRIIYKQKNDYAYVVMLRVGKHEDVYN